MIGAPEPPSIDARESGNASIIHPVIVTFAYDNNNKLFTAAKNTGAVSDVEQLNSVELDEVVETIYNFHVAEL